MKCQSSLLMPYHVLFVFIGCAALLLGCSDSSTGPEDDLPDGATALLIITGDLEAQKAGRALFSGAGVGGTENGWSLNISDADLEAHTYNFLLQFVYDEPVERPQPGTYDIGNYMMAESLDEPVFSGSYTDLENQLFYISLTQLCGADYAPTGTLTIERSTQRFVAGIFEFEAYYSNAQDCDRGEFTQTITINGEFEAENPFATGL